MTEFKTLAPPRSRGWTPRAEETDRIRTGSPALAGMDPAGMDPALAVCPVQGCGLPRARGDGPTTVNGRPSHRTAPPRSRGWTRRNGSPARRSRGSPALAGMDPPGRPSAPTPSGLPRARGDGPWSVRDIADPDAAPPRSRGWTRVEDASERRSCGSPALAGMDPTGTSDAACAVWLPRARGDGPEAIARVAVGALAPPRSRGWTRADREGRHPTSGSPALAGMDLEDHLAGDHGPGLPRARGDGPFSIRRSRPSLSAPPRSRGWTRAPRFRSGSPGGSPALAGMDPGVEACP